VIVAAKVLLIVIAVSAIAYAASIAIVEAIEWLLDDGESLQ
jgi:hypothetical protein